MSNSLKCISCGSLSLGYWSQTSEWHGTGVFIGLPGTPGYAKHPACKECTKLVGIDHHGFAPNIFFTTNLAFELYVDEKRKLWDQADEIQKLKASVKLASESTSTEKLFGNLIGAVLGLLLYNYLFRGN